MKTRYRVYQDGRGGGTGNLSLTEALALARHLLTEGYAVQITPEE